MYITISSDLFQIVKGLPVSDILGWIIAAFGTFVVYKFFDNISVRMQRHAIVNEVEMKINTLFSAEFAFAINKDKKDNHNEDDYYKKLQVRTVLDDSCNWEFPVKTEEEERKASIVVYNNQRYVQIRKDTNENADQQYVSTQAIHEILIIFRRIEKLYKDRIMLKVDLCDLWREILPFATSNRIAFFYNYLNDYDTSSMIYVIMQTVIACDKYKNIDAIKYIQNNTKEEIDWINKVDSRLRFTKDTILKTRFRNIMGI